MIMSFCAYMRVNKNSLVLYMNKKWFFIIEIEVTNYSLCSVSAGGSFIALYAGSSSPRKIVSAMSR